MANLEFTPAPSRAGMEATLLPTRSLDTPRWKLPAATLAPLKPQPPVRSAAGEGFTLIQVHRDQPVHSGQTILAVRPDGLRGRLYLRLGSLGQTEACLAPVRLVDGRLVDPAGFNMHAPEDQAAVVARYPYGTRILFPIETLTDAINLVEAPVALPEPRPSTILPSYLRPDAPERESQRPDENPGRGFHP